MEQQGRALVVGGAGAIGEACVRALLARGTRVVVADLDASAAERVAGATGADAATAVDVRETASVRDAVGAAADALGGLDVAVNLAAVGGPAARLHEYGDDDWDRVLSVNLTGVFRCVREQLSVLLAGGGGSIVCVSSVGAGVGFAGAGAYATSKHALTGLVRSAAVEYAADGIRVNAVAPGFVDTPFLRGRRSSEEIAVLEAAHPAGRLASPTEVASVVDFLASPAAAFVTGSCYGVDGGFLAGAPGLISR